MPKNQLSVVYRYLIGKNLISGKADFAAKLQYNRVYISEILNDKKPITQKIAQILLDKYSINPEWLLNNEGEMIVLNERSASYSLNSTSGAKQKAKILRAAMKIMEEYADKLENEVRKQQKGEAKKSSS